MYNIHTYMILMNKKIFYPPALPSLQDADDTVYKEALKKLFSACLMKKSTSIHRYNVRLEKGSNQLFVCIGNVR